MTTTPTAAPIGTEIAHRQAGAVYIQIVKASGGFTVNCFAGPDKVPGWCQSYTTWDEAKDEANRARDAYRLHGSTDAIDRRRQLLICDRDQYQRRHAAARSATTQATFRQLIAGIDRELVALEDLSTRALAPQFVADMTRRLAA